MTPSWVRSCASSEPTAAGARLVFVRTKRGADRLVKRLAAHNVTAVAMHGNKSQSQRQKALASFEGGRVGTLVATDVAARGIDVPEMTQVINFDAPEDRDAYVHRVGRTGRAGREGAGVSFVLADQARDMGRIAAELGLKREFEHGREPAPLGRLRTASRPEIAAICGDKGTGLPCRAERLQPFTDSESRQRGMHLHLWRGSAARGAAKWRARH